MYSELIALASILEQAEHFGDYVGHIWPIVVAGVFLVGGYFKAKAGFKKVVKIAVQEETEPIKQQFKNNGGSSMKDAMDRMDNKLDLTALALVDHTASDTANFEHITTTLLKIIENQVSTKAIAEQVSNKLDNDAVVVKQAIQDRDTKLHPSE